jgi:hypothetical protein
MTDTFGPVGTQIDFRARTDFEEGQHVIYHNAEDGLDYEAVITDVYSSSNDVEAPEVAHIDAGFLGHLKNVSISAREEPNAPGTFSLKPVAPPDAPTDGRRRVNLPKLVSENGPGQELPIRSDENRRPPTPYDSRIANAIDGVPDAGTAEVPDPDVPLDKPMEENVTYEQREQGSTVEPLAEVRDDNDQRNKATPDDPMTLENEAGPADSRPDSEHALFGFGEGPAEEDMPPRAPDQQQQQAATDADNAKAARHAEETKNTSDAQARRAARDQGNVDEGAEESHPVDEYATGGGWYDVPDAGKVQGRDNAIAAYDETH